MNKAQLRKKYPAAMQIDEADIVKVTPCPTCRVPEGLYCRRKSFEIECHLMRRLLAYSEAAWKHEVALAKLIK